MERFEVCDRLASNDDGMGAGAGKASGEHHRVWGRGESGDRVRLRPQKSADIVDMALKGKVAIVEAIEGDTDDHIHLAVVLDDDPAAIWECCGSEVNCIHSLLAQ